MKENLERAWTMMILLHCSLAALVVSIIAIRFFIETFSENATTPHLFDLHWGSGLSVAALGALRIAWRSKALSSPNKVHWRHRARRFMDLVLLLCALLLPASGVSMILWSGQDIEWSGHVLIAAGPKSTELRDLSRIFHEISAVFLPLSLAGHLILSLASTEQRSP